MNTSTNTINHEQQSEREHAQGNHEKSLRDHEKRVFFNFAKRKEITCILSCFFVLFVVQPSFAAGAVKQQGNTQVNGDLTVTNRIITSLFTLGAVQITATGTEINYLSGLSGPLTTLLDGKVDTTTTINSYPLSSNVTLDADDIGDGATNAIITLTQEGNFETAYTHSQVTTGNPHSVTASEVGLGNVDNTADADKPVSTATQTALDAKVTGPASATDSAVAQFDGTTGKLLKDGLTVGTAANNLIQLDGSARLPAVDGSQLTNLPGGSGIDSTAIHKDTAAEISTITEKAAPVSADLIIIEDSADSNNKKKVQIGNLPAFTGDSGAGGAKGFVPAPAAGDAAAGKFLKADGTFAVPPGAGGGETNTASNTGSAGLGIFKQKATYDLEFYKVLGSDGISFALNGTDYIDAKVDITSLSEKTTPVTGDYFMMYDSAAGANKKVAIANMPGGGSGSGITWNEISSNTTVSSGNGYIVDTSGGSLTLTFPASPSIGDMIYTVNLYTTYAFTINPNGNEIENSSSNTAAFGVGGNLFVYTTDVGWKVYSNYINYSTQITAAKLAMWGKSWQAAEFPQAWKESVWTNVGSNRPTLDYDQLNVGVWRCDYATAEGLGIFVTPAIPSGVTNLVFTIVAQPQTPAASGSNMGWKADIVRYRDNTAESSIETVTLGSTAFKATGSTHASYSVAVSGLTNSVTTGDILAFIIYPNTAVSTPKQTDWMVLSISIGVN